MISLKCKIWILAFSMVTLYDPKLNSPNWPFFGIFNEYVNIARFAHNVEWDFFLRFSNIVLDIWLMNSLGGNPFFCESQGRTTELSSDGIYYCLELPGKMEERSSSRENKMQITQTKVTFSFGKNNTEMREGPLITKEKWGNNGNFDCKRKEINLKLPASNVSLVFLDYLITVHNGKLRLKGMHGRTMWCCWTDYEWLIQGLLYQFCPKSTRENQARGNRKTLKCLRMTTKANFRTLKLKSHEEYLVYRTYFIK